MSRAEQVAELKAHLGAASALADALAIETPAAVTPPPPPPPAPAPAAGALPFTNEGAFYDWLRGNSMLGPKISPSEYQGCTAILGACASARFPLADTAYTLATAYLETAASMQPVKEANWLSPKAAHAYFMRMYDITGQRPAKARELGNLTPGDGALFCGRGYPQMTGKTNYARANKVLPEYGIHGVDLLANPDDAMRPDVAAVVMTDGMGKGWFTGKKLRDYLPAKGPATRVQFKGARRIINGQDRADDVAGFALNFQQALQAGGWSI